MNKEFIIFYEYQYIKPNPLQKQLKGESFVGYVKVEAEDEKKAIKAAERFLYKVVKGLMIVVANLQIYRE